MYLDDSLVAMINKYSIDKVFLADLKHIENVGLKIRGSAVILLEQGEDSGILNNMLFEDSLHPKLGVNKDGSSILDYRN